MTNVDERFKLPKIKRAKVIAFLGLLSGVILLIVGLSATRIYGTTGNSYIFGSISAIMTIIWACLALISSVLLLREKNLGYALLLIAGIGAIIGNFIPIYSYTYDPWGYGGYLVVIYLNSTGSYVDIALMLIGGIYGVALPDKKADINKLSKF